MKIRALCSFVGIVCMAKGEAREVSDELAFDLLAAGYVEILEGERKRIPKKAVGKGENP